MGKIFLASLFCFLFCVSVFSQGAQKIDEFGNLPCEHYLARMDSIIITAQTNPTSQLYVLVYDGNSVIQNSDGKSISDPPRFGAAKARIASMKKFISNVRKFSGDKFTFIDAGFREAPLIEFWLVPQKAAPPKPAPTITKMKYRKGKAKGFCLSCCENQ